MGGVFKHDKGDIMQAYSVSVRMQQMNRSVDGASELVQPYRVDGLWWRSDTGVGALEPRVEVSEMLYHGCGREAQARPLIGRKAGIIWRQ